MSPAAAAARTEYRTIRAACAHALSPLAFDRMAASLVRELRDGEDARPSDWLTAAREIAYAPSTDD